MRRLSTLPVVAVLALCFSLPSSAVFAGPDIPTLWDPHPPALNTGTCKYHGDYSFDDARYDLFASSLSGPFPEVRDLESRVELHQVGGVSVVVIEGGAALQRHWYGCRDRKRAERTTSDTLYQAASTSKFVAAIGMVKGDRLGDLDLDADMRMLVSDYPVSLLAEWVAAKFKSGARNYPAEITMRRLLSHSAGLDTSGINAWRPGSVPSMREIVMGSLLYQGWFSGGVQPILAPRTEYEYSGGGYVIAEHALELQTGGSFKNYLTQKVLVPAAMLESTFETASSTMPNLARGCSRSSCNFDILQTSVKAAGGLLVSADEYAHLLTALVNGGVTWLGHRVMTQADIRQLLTPAAHKLSSYAACSVPGQTRHSYTTIGGVQIPFVEICVASTWRVPLEAGDDQWYGLGVKLSQDLLADGYPRRVKHSGAQTGARAYFRLDRASGNGLVVMINGVEEWIDGNGDLFGADPLLDEIVEAYRAVYE